MYLFNSINFFWGSVLTKLHDGSLYKITTRFVHEYIQKCIYIYTHIYIYIYIYIYTDTHTQTHTHTHTHTHTDNKLLRLENNLNNFCFEWGGNGNVRVSSCGARLLRDTKIKWKMPFLVSFLIIILLLVLTSCARHLVFRYGQIQLLLSLTCSYTFIN